MPQKNDVIEIGAFKTKRQPGDLVEIAQVNCKGIVNLGEVLEVKRDDTGVTSSLLVKIIA